MTDPPDVSSVSSTRCRLLITPSYVSQPATNHKAPATYYGAIVAPGVA